MLKMKRNKQRSEVVRSNITNKLLCWLESIMEVTWSTNKDPSLMKTLRFLGTPSTRNILSSSSSSFVISDDDSAAIKGFWVEMVTSSASFSGRIVGPYCSSGWAWMKPISSGWCVSTSRLDWWINSPKIHKLYSIEIIKLENDKYSLLPAIFRSDAAFRNEGTCCWLTVTVPLYIYYWKWGKSVLGIHINTILQTSDLPQLKL